MEILDITLRVLSGVVIGFAIGLTGIGGGVLVMPTLVLLFKLPATVTVGTASLYAMLTKIYASYEHYKLKAIDRTATLIFLVGALPGNIITAWLINNYVKRYKDNQSVLVHFQNQLKTFIACVILVSVIILILNLFRRNQPETNVVNPHTWPKKILGALFGIIVGALMGATSIGGGVLVIPLLIIFFGLSATKTVGTSISIAVVLTLVTSIIYAKGGQIDYHTALIMALGSIGGVYAGSRLSAKLPEKTLKAVITSIILVAAILMLVN